MHPLPISCKTQLLAFLLFIITLPFQLWAPNIHIITLVPPSRTELQYLHRDLDRSRTQELI